MQMKVSLKHTIYLTLSCVVLLVMAVVVWSLIPLHPNQNEADPAVVFMSQRLASAPAIRESYFHHQGQNLHYVQSGKESQDVILFVHGFPSYWYSFVRQIEAFRKDYRIIAIDGLGAGKSDAPSNEEHYKLDIMSEHLNALLKHLKVEKVHLVGHDWGAAMVFGFAQKYPERVISVTGISAPPPNVMLALLESNQEQRAKSHYVDRLKSANSILLAALRAPNKVWHGAYLPLVDAGKLGAEEGRLFQSATRSSKRINAHINWYRANIPSIDDIKEGDFWPGRRSRIDVPALIVWGKDDRVFVEEFIEIMEKNSDDLQVTTLDGVGHWPHIEAPQAVNSAIKHRLQSTR